jgi:3-methyladenine DNA glycosylase AlkC
MSKLYFDLVTLENKGITDESYDELVEAANTFVPRPEEGGEETVSNFLAVKAAMTEILVKAGIVRLEVTGDNGETDGSPLIAKGWDVKSACTAANSYFFYRTWDHPATRSWFHVRSATVEVLPEQGVIGYIHANMDRKVLADIKANFPEFRLVTVPDFPKEQNHNEWSILRSELDLVRTDKYLGMGNWGKNVMNKHRWIEHFIRGRGIHIWIGKDEDRSQYAVTFLMEWLQRDPEMALIISQERQEAAKTNRALRAVWAHTNRSVIEGNAPEADTDQDTGEQKLMVQVHGQSRRVNILNQPAQSVHLYDFSGKYVTTERWDPNNPSTVAYFRGDDKVKGAAEVCKVVFLGK